MCGIKLTVLHCGYSDDNDAVQTHFHKASPINSKIRPDDSVHKYAVHISRGKYRECVPTERSQNSDLKHLSHRHTNEFY